MSKAEELMRLLEVLSGRVRELIMEGRIQEAIELEKQTEEEMRRIMQSGEDAA